MTKVDSCWTPYHSTPEKFDGKAGIASDVCLHVQGSVETGQGHQGYPGHMGHFCLGQVGQWMRSKLSRSTQIANKKINEI